jgi:6-phosphogluconolactonase
MFDTRRWAHTCWHPLILSPRIAGREWVPTRLDPTRMGAVVCQVMFLAVGLFAASVHAQGATMTVLFGTYATGDQQGIYASQFDPTTGALTDPQRVADVPNPGFFALDGGGTRLVAVGRGTAGTPLEAGRIAALKIDPENGQMELLNELPTEGKGPCHVSLHPSGRFAAVANYGSGSVEVFALEGDGIDEEGKIVRQTSLVQHEGSSVDPERQEGPHAHSIYFSPDGRFALAADLGLDRVIVYRFDEATGSLTEQPDASASVPPGHGPRHLAFHPTLGYVYAVNEMGGSVTALQYDAQTGKLNVLETVDALPEGYSEPRRAAEIAVHPNGKTLYCSHRGHDSVATLAIDASSGRLALLSTASTSGSWPRNFCLDPTGKWIVAANQNGDNAVVLKIDEATGEARETGVEISVPQAICVRFWSASP